VLIVLQWFHLLLHYYYSCGTLLTYLPCLLYAGCIVIVCIHCTTTDIIIVFCCSLLYSLLFITTMPLFNPFFHKPSFGWPQLPVLVASCICFVRAWNCWPTPIFATFTAAASPPLYCLVYIVVVVGGLVLVTLILVPKQLHWLLLTIVTAIQTANCAACCWRLLLLQVQLFDHCWYCCYWYC